MIGHITETGSWKVNETQIKVSFIIPKEFWLAGNWMKSYMRCWLFMSRSESLLHIISAHFQYSQYMEVKLQQCTSVTLPAAEKPLNLQIKSKYCIFIKFITSKWVLASPCKSALIGWFEQFFCRLKLSFQSFILP